MNEQTEPAGVQYRKLDNYKKLEVDFAIPEFVQISIDRVIKGIETNDGLTDCYIDDLACNIKSCIGDDYTAEQGYTLLRYYCKGGIFHPEEE